MLLELYRDPSREDGTRGSLMQGDDEICSMLELQWLDNQPFKSCIPPGKYEVKYLAESASGKYKDVYHIQDVPGRSGILMHKGNWAGDADEGQRTDSTGCQLPCMGYTIDDNHQTMGHSSKTAMQILHETTGRKDFTLEIWGV